MSVTSPNGGEDWTIGTEQTILWTSVNTSENVKIELSRDGGQNWGILAEDTQNDGSYEWVVTVPSSDSCLIRISDITGAPADSSDSLFTISEIPVITVEAPNGGEDWTIGLEQTILWTSVNISENVKIELSRDGGQNWGILAENTQNDGS